MIHIPKAVIVAACCLVWAWGTAAKADRVLMNDGTSREGTVISHNDKTLLLRVGDNGFHMTVSIPMSDIFSITMSQTKPKPSATAPATAPTVSAPATNTTATIPTATTNPAVATVTPEVPHAHSSNQFFKEWLLLGLGRDAATFDPESLPPNQELLWIKSLQDDASGDKVEEVAVLTSLATVPGADARMFNKLSMRYHSKLFGRWLGELRWNQIKVKNHFGQFDLTQVTPIETPTLVSLMHDEMADVLFPLKPYYPLPPALADLPKASRPVDPLTSITVENGLGIKQAAFYAAALLSGQLTLQPEMKAADKSFLLQNLGSLHAIIARCAELDPQIRAAQEKARTGH